MAMYEIAHMDAAETMTVEAESPSKAKYKNYLAWSDAFNIDDFKGYIKGLIYCKKIKQSTETCTAYVPVITNADRIRAMSDEELAAWAINEAPKIGFRYTSSETGLLKWLKQPAEDDD